MQQQLKNFKRHLRLAFIVPLLLAAALGGVFTLETYYLRNAMQEVDHSYLVQTRSRSLLKLLLDMETGLRGYLLTGEEHFLQPYRVSTTQVGPALDELEALTASDSRQQQLVRELKISYGEWHQFSTHMIAMRERGESVDAPALNLEGKRIMDRIRARRDELLQIEQGRLQQQIARVRWMLTSIFATAAMLSLFIGLAIALFSRREFASVLRTFDSALRTSFRRTEELHESQRWLEAVLSNIGDGVIATDGEGKMVFSNPVSRQILGREEDEIRQARTHDAIHIFDEYTHASADDPFQQVMKTRAPVFADGHLVLQRKDGSLVPVAMQAFPIRDGDRVNGAVIVLRDITLQRQSERTLQSAEKLASIGRIAATVAHEIHNPLDALGNLLYLIEHSEGLSDSNKTYVRLAREELERVTSISEQMLTFSRETRQPVEVRLAEVMENVLTLYAARIRRLGVVVVRNFEPSGTVNVFPGEMRQVFSNLIGNALDAMNGRGKLTLRIDQRRDWSGELGYGVRVMVCDTGPGVPEEVRDKLMEPFVTSKGEKGTGLGLWVCRGIVEKYHGQLRYRTSTVPGRSGTCFSIVLPASTSEPKSSREMTKQRAS
jgi:PAS domain S-box-containing protein